MVHSILRAWRKLSPRQRGLLVVALIALLWFGNSYRHHPDLQSSIRAGSRIWLEVHLLIRRDPDVADRTGIPPLACAVLERNAWATARLLDKGANPDGLVESGDLAGWGPLAIAVGRGDLRFAGYLLSRGADPNLPNPTTGATALHLVADVAMARLLIEHGADVNARDLREQTPLHHAVIDGERAVIRCLLASGADPTLADAQGDDAVELARLAGRPEVYRTLCGAKAAWIRAHDEEFAPRSVGDESTESGAATAP
jgi:uncharacterized protein